MTDGPAFILENAIDALTRGDALHLRLLSCVHRRSDKRIAVGLAYRDLKSCATVGGDAAGAPAGAALVATGCITKLFTAAMMMKAIGEGRFSLDDAAGELLSRAARVGHHRALQGVSVQHLLEHTHGLDSSPLTQAPVREDGFIDAARLCRELQDGERLHEPGLLYSYGECGAWLSAAILEECYRQPFRMLLDTQLFAPMGMTVGAHTLDAPVCPSSGGALAVPLEGLLQFLLAHCPLEGGLAPGEITPLPGWSSQECGIRLGWKHYGSGWFGHNSALPGAAGLVRVHPAQKIAVVVTSADHSLTNVVARLFGNLWPQLAALRIPKALNPQETASLVLTRYTGTYASGPISVSISRSRSSTLELRAHRREHGRMEREPFVSAALVAARDEVFFTVPSHTEQFPFVQFIVPSSRGFQFLWNGRCVWPLAPSHSRN